MADTENKKVTGGRQKLYDRLKAKYPDKNMDDDEVFYGAINDDYDGLDAENKGYKEREKSLSDMFTKDPRSASFLTNWRKGGDPVVELVKQFGTDIKDALDDPDRQEDIAKANQEYLERVAREKDLDGEYQKNLEQTLSELEPFQQENGLSDDEVDDVMEAWRQIVNDGIIGKCTPETMDMVLKALRHDDDVNAAGEEGEIRGKNAKIDMKLRKRRKGDGLPNLGGGNGTSGQAPEAGQDIFSIARQAK